MRPGAGRLEGPQLQRLSQVATALVMDTHGIGDVLMTLPALTELVRHLDAPDRMEILLRGPLEAGLVRRTLPGVRIATLSNLGGGALARWILSLRGRGSCVALSTFNVAPRKAWLTGLAAGAEWSVGFTRGSEKPFTVNLAPSGLHKIEENYRLLQALDLPHERTSYSWIPSSDELNEAGALLKGASDTVALTPGSNPGETFKRWPVERYGELARRMASELELDVVIVGGPSDREAAQAIRRAAGRAVTSRILDLTGKLPLEVSAGVMAKSRAVVGGDCGLTHLASAMGLPTLVLAGPTRPAITGPRGPHTRILRSTHYCTACYERELRIDPDCDHPACMEDHRVGPVFEALTGFL